MDDLVVFLSKHLDAFLTLLLGISLPLVANRRSTLVYTTMFSTLGRSARDRFHGSVKIVWNETFEATQLSLGTVEVHNNSLKDLTNLKLKLYTGNAHQIVTAYARIDNSPEVLDLTEEFIEASGLSKTEDQRTDIDRSIYFGQREYFLPVLNRRQKIIIECLLNSVSEVEPAVFVSCQAPSVRVKHKIRFRPLEYLFGVPMNEAVWAGIPFCMLLTYVLTLKVASPWLLGFVSLFVGVLVAVPGAVLIRSHIFVRDRIVG